MPERSICSKKSMAAWRDLSVVTVFVKSFCKKRNRGRQIDGVSLHPGQCNITALYWVGNLFPASQCTCIAFTFSVRDFTGAIVFAAVVSDRTITDDWQEKKASMLFLVERKWLLLNVSVFIWCTIPQMENKYFKSLCCIPAPWVVMPYRKVVGLFSSLFLLLLFGWLVLWVFLWYFFLFCFSLELLGLHLKPTALIEILFFRSL